MKKKPSKTRSAVSPSQSDAPPAAATPSEAQRLAAAILECLAGVRSPPEAAELIGVSLPRYYQLETRALEGLVTALGPRPRGKQPSLELTIARLEKELEAARRDCARQEALVRVTQRSMGWRRQPSRRQPPPVVRALERGSRWCGRYGQLAAYERAPTRGLDQRSQLR